MTIEIIGRQTHAKGVLYIIKVSGKITNILYLFHAIERIKKWGITDEMVAETLLLQKKYWLAIEIDILHIEDMIII